jgi:hypothetical protein
MNTIIEIATTEAAVAIVDAYAKSKKLNAFQLCLLVPGIVHTHDPTEKNVEECAYCRRNGNVFGDRTTAETDDIISRYNAKVEKIYEEMERELVTELESKSS